MSFIDNLRNSLADHLEYGMNVEEGKKKVNINPETTQEQYEDKIRQTEGAINLLKLFSTLGGAAAGGMIGGPIGAAVGGLGGFATAQASSEADKARAKDPNAFIDVNKEDSDDSKDEEALAAGQGEDVSSAEDKKEEKVVAPQYDVDEMAGEFILGAWGNGQDRIDNMINAGYSLDDYNKIQNRVNEAYMSGRDLHEWTNKANEKLRYW